MFHSCHPSLRAFGFPLARGNPSILLLCFPQRYRASPACRRQASGSGLKLTQLRFDWVVEAGSEKKADRLTVVPYGQRKTPMLCRWPVLRTQPNSRCSATITGAEQVLRARFFRLASWVHTDLVVSPTRSVWRFHVPRIWIRSINGRKFSVKRKTQNVGDVFVLHLSVVVPFLINHLRLNTFRSVAAHATILASNSR